MKKLLALVPVLALLAACSAGGGDSSEDESASAGAADTAVAEQDLRPGGGTRAGQEFAGDGAGKPARTAVRTRAIISQGQVSLRAKDVDAARREVQKVLDTVGGTISNEETSTGRQGVVRSSRLELRVPAARFDETMTTLAGIATLTDISRSSEDVTTEVIDTDVRIRAQEKSLRRIEQLLAQATDIGDVVAIESELTRRQAELDSLKGQQAFLDDQTTLATIAVYLERADTPRPAEEEEDTGFLAGLTSGWDALTSTLTVAATVAGALIPWLVLLGLVLVPVTAVLRRRRRSSPVPPAAPPAPAG